MPISPSSRESVIEQIIGACALCVGLSLGTGGAQLLLSVIGGPAAARACAIMFGLVGASAIWLSFFDAPILRRLIMVACLIAWVYVSSVYFSKHQSPPIAYVGVVMSCLCLTRIVGRPA